MRFEGFSTENKQLVQTVSTSAQTLPEDIFESHTDRLSSRGGHFTKEQMIPVYFAGLIGTPADAEADSYHNILYNLREKLIGCPKLLIYIENTIKPPAPDELSFFDAVSRGDNVETRDDFISLIKISGDTVRTELAKKVFTEFTEKKLSDSSEGFFNYCAALITWLYRCVSSEAYRNNLSEIPILMYYGNINEKTLEFLHFISRIGIDVVYITSDRSMFDIIKRNNLDGRMQVFDYPYSKPVSQYPDKPVKTKYATIAYNAEKELNTVLYDNTTVFKDFQYSKMQSRTLKTTYEEIDILWHQPSKFRSGFEVINDAVIIPNLFVKISGVKDGNLNAYWDNVRLKLSPTTRIITKAPAYNKYDFSKLKAYQPFLNGNSILIEKLKTSPFNNYGFLSDDLQYLIFSKLQEAADSGLLKLDENELLPMILYVGLNIDREVLRILQKYDYTKDIPKFIIVDVIEETFSKIECIQLVLYNLLGFDIAVFTPTGYRNLETYISESAYEAYTMNEFKYNVSIPRFKIPDNIPDTEGGGLFNKLFKKGRK